MRKAAIIAASLMAGTCAFAQNAAVSTDLALWAYFITPNVSAQYALGRHWSAEAGAAYNAWSFRTGGEFEERREQQLKARQQTYRAGVRWWTWNVYSGWWLGAGVLAQEYDNGGRTLLPWIPENEYGTQAGADLRAGYAYQLSTHWDIDFSLGIMGGYRKYTVYGCPYCGTVEEQGEKVFFAPGAAALSLVYIF